MKRLLSLGLASLLLASPAHSQLVFRDATGNPVPEKESARSRDDFGGVLLATTDEDWREKWDTPPETKPQFSEAKAVPPGKQVFILTFFTNPKIDESGKANIRCDVKIADPAGKISFVQKDMNCFSGRIKGSPYNMYLSSVIGWMGEAGDPTGTWVVDVVLRDTMRNTELPLRTRFDLLSK